MQIQKAGDLVVTIEKELEKAVKMRCNCDFTSSNIYSEKFSCQTIGNVLSTHLTYRAILNGSSDFLPVSTALGHIQDWVDSKGTIDYSYFRLKLTNTRRCKLSIESLDDKEC